MIHSKYVVFRSGKKCRALRRPTVEACVTEGYWGGPTKASFVFVRVEPRRHGDEHRARLFYRKRHREIRGTGKKQITTPIVYRFFERCLFVSWQIVRETLYSQLFEFTYLKEGFL